MVDACQNFCDAFQSSDLSSEPIFRALGARRPSFASLLALSRASRCSALIPPYSASNMAKRSRDVYEDISDEEIDELADDDNEELSMGDGTVAGFTQAWAKDLPLERTLAICTCIITIQLSICYPLLVRQRWTCAPLYQTRQQRQRTRKAVSSSTSGKTPRAN